jgi:hypothetical protein
VFQYKIERITKITLFIFLILFTKKTVKKYPPTTQAIFYLVKTCIARCNFFLSAGDRVTVHNHMFLSNYRYLYVLGFLTVVTTTTLLTEILRAEYYAGCSLFEKSF